MLKKSAREALIAFLAFLSAPTVQGFHNPSPVPGCNGGVDYKGAGVRVWARHKHIIAGDEYRQYFQRVNWKDDDVEESEGGNAWQADQSSSRGGRNMDEEEQAYYERINAYQGTDSTQPDMSLSAVTSSPHKVSLACLWVLDIGW